MFNQRTVKGRVEIAFYGVYPALSGAVVFLLHPVYYLNSFLFVFGDIRSRAEKSARVLGEILRNNNIEISLLHVGVFFLGENAGGSFGVEKEALHRLHTVRSDCLDALNAGVQFGWRDQLDGISAAQEQ